MKPRKPKIKKPRKNSFTGKLRGKNSINSIEYLKSHKKNRFKKSVKTSAITGTTALAAGFGGSFMNNHGFQKSLAIALASGIFGVSVGAREVFKEHSSQTKKALQEVQASLKKEAKMNPAFNNFVHQYKYIFVNRKGNIVGTNRKRINLAGVKLGRLRIETEKLRKKENI